MMKKLTKIRLLNWHIFNNHTIEIKGNVLVTGENGHGKSTLLDAVNFVLSGGKGKFNQAANSTNLRSVESYMKGKVGVEGKTFIRDDDNIVTHIALEFFDDSIKEHFVIGVVLEMPLKSKHGTFYHILNSQIKDTYYEKDGFATYLSEIKSIVNSSGKSINTFKTLKDINGMLKETLGLSGDKYFELLPKALAFKPIHDVNKFVYDFLLPEDKVDIKGLKINIHSYREIVRMLEIEEDKRSILSPLLDINHQYNETLRITDAYESFLYKIEINYCDYKIDYYIGEEKQSKNKYSEVLTEIEQFQEKLESVEKDIRSYESSEDIAKYNRMEDRISELKSSIAIAEEKKKSAFDLIEKEKGIAKNINISANFDKYFKEENYDSFTTSVRMHSSKIDDLKLSNNQKLTKKQIEFKKLENEKEINDKKLQKLRQKRFSYPHYVENLLRGIKEDLENTFFDNEISVKPLCEFLEIDEENEAWRNTIEGYLNARKFDIIVEPRYYNKALETYDRIKFEKNIYGVGLVNIKEHKEYIKLENSLASKVSCKSKHAENVINSIIGDVICVEDIHKLREYKKSVTISGMTYRNFTARQLNKRWWEEPFIGRNAIDIQIRNTNKKLEELNNLMIELNSQINKCVEIQKEIGKSQIYTLFSFKNVFDQIRNYKNDIEDKKKDLKAIKQSSLFVNIDTLLNKAKGKKKELKDLIEEAKTKKYGYKKDIDDSRNYQEDFLKQKTEFEEDYKLLNIEFDVENRVKNLEQKYQIKKDTDYKNNKRIITNMIKKSNEIKNYLSRDIESILREYVSKYDKEIYIPNIQNVESFINKLNDIETRNIIEYKERANEALIRCEKSFEEDFLSKLREKINHSRDRIKLLNKSLKRNPFGTDAEIYAFKIGRSKNGDFGRYFDIIDTNEEFRADSLFTETLSDENAHILKELFNRLTVDSTNEKQIKEIEEFTDYRKYMNYDIEIKNRNNETCLLSKVNREKSGGETQTPFYVIIASSFEQLIESSSRNKSTACVVLFDEAFNNMDESRTEAMMEYYKKLNIQLIIAVPPKRTSNISPFVETKLGVVKSNDTVVVDTYYERISERE